MKFSFLNTLRIVLALFSTSVCSLYANISEYYPSTECCEDFNCFDECSRFFFHADLLYWKARQEGLDFSLETTRETSTTTITTGGDTEISRNKFNDHSFNFDWRTGFRIGGGYNFRCGWILAADWTHYQGHAKGHGHDHGLNSSGRWKLHYDVLDVIALSPYLCPNFCFDWNFFGGLRAARIDQKLHTHEEFLSISTTTSTTGTSTTVNTGLENFFDKTDFRGIGPQIGLQAAWCLGKGFSLCGNLGGAILYSHYRARYNASSDFTETFSGTTTFVDITHSKSHEKTNIRTCQTVADFGLKICWERDFCLWNHETALLLELGWEHHQWFDHGQIAENGDLTFDGLVFSGTILF